MDFQTWLADIHSVPADARPDWSSKMPRIPPEGQPASFRSERHFTLFSYKGERGELLFRSRKSEEHPTRLDVLITDVSALEIRCWSDGLEIEETDIRTLVGNSLPLEVAEGRRAFSVTGKSWRGFILGGAVYTHEDERHWTDPSVWEESASAYSDLAGRPPS